MYNLSILNNASGMTDFVSAGNTFTDGVLVQLLVVSIFVILLLALKRYEFDTDITVSSFLCFGISLFLSYAKLLPFMYPLVFGIVTAFGILYMYTVNR